MWGLSKINEFSYPLVRRAAQVAWFIYFSVSIIVIGLIFAYGVVVPLYIAGFLFPSSRKLADKIMRWGIGLLMTVQPWLNGQICQPQSFEGGHLLVSNHRSHLDAFILLSRISGIRILAKKSLFSFPGIGILMRLSKQIPLSAAGIDSYLGAMQAVQNRLRDGETVHVFPEMTRCEAGHEGTLTFSVVPFRVAYQERIPIVPIAFIGTDLVWPKGKIGLHYRQEVKATMLETVDPREFNSAQELRDEVKRRIEQALL